MDREHHNRIHEDFSRAQAIQNSSDRAFGLVFAAFFALVALGPLVRHHQPRLWALLPAAIFLLASLALPATLAPLNALWAKFGALLQKIVNPIVMGVLFFATITPIAFIMRRLKKDPLQLAWQADARTYWIARTPPGPAPQTMKDQF